MGIGTAYSSWSVKALDRLPPVILACGPEASLKQEMIDELEEQFPNDDREVISVYAHESSPEQVIRELNSQGLFNDSKWVLLKQLALRESGQPELKRYYDAIEQYLEDPDEDALLVLYDEDHPYTGGRKTGGMARAVEEAGGEAVVFWEPFDREVFQRVQTAFEDAGVEWESGVIDLIVEKTEGKLSRISQEVEQLIDYRGGDGRVTRSDVERVVSSEMAEDSLDALKQALVSGSASQIMEELSDCYRRSSSGDEVRLAHTTLFYLQELRDIRRSIREGDSLESALDDRGIPTSKGVKEKHRTALKALRERFPRDFFRKGYSLLKDVKYNRSPMDRRSLEQFMLKSVPSVVDMTR